jgi:tetratricopeptide (TPR) repeat protein
MKSWFKSKSILLKIILGALLLGFIAVQDTQAGDSELEAWKVCLQQVDLSCALLSREAVVGEQGHSELSAEELELEARTLFHEGRYRELELVLELLTYPETDPEDAPPYRATIAASKGLFRYEQAEELIEIRHGRGVEAVLAEEAMDTLVAAKKEYRRIFGGIPEHGLVLDIFPTAARFIAASGLPSEAVRTTGVIALSKWNRLLLTSPRAMSAGYDWKDTIAHEYVHLVVAWRTGDRAPVWLQEGLAKFFEGTWKDGGQVQQREKGAYLTSYQQSLLAKALESGTFVPFEKFRYSMAYLESSEEAALAFAQVSSMIDFLYTSSGEAAFSTLMEEVKKDRDPMLVVAELAGKKDFAEFEAAWKAYIRTLPLVQETLVGKPVALDGAGGDFAADPLLSKRKDLARYARIGDLLLEKKRPKAALVEYTKAIAGGEAEEESEPPSPHLLAQEARCHFLLGNFTKALKLSNKGLSLYPEYPLLYIGKAEILEAQGRRKDALVAWEEAHDIDPYQPKIERALAEGYQHIGSEDLAARHQRYLGVLESGGARQIGSSQPLWPIVGTSESP